MNQNKDNPFVEIVGTQLSAVTFVQDYIQLDFNGFKLTAITLPKVRINNSWFDIHKPGYRDALCECISRYINNAMITENEILICCEEILLSISLAEEDRYGPQAAIFNSEHGTWVW